MLLIRPVRVEDAESFLNLRKTLDTETSFMMLEPGERTTTLPEQRASLETALRQDRDLYLVAEVDGRLAGYLSTSRGTYRRNRHSAYIVVGVLQEFAGQGIGTRLFEALDAWARENGLRRLELTVMTHNTRGLALYRKMGFEIEGTRRDSLLVDGRYVDEYAMSKCYPKEKS